MSAVHHLNFCRQIIQQLSEILKKPEGLSRNVFDPIFLTYILYAARYSQKFLLPDSGRLYDDPEYKALDETQPLHLPFPMIALEYQRKAEPTRGDQRSSKAVIFAEEKKDFIQIAPCAWFDELKLWVPMPSIGIPQINYLDRKQKFGRYVGVKVQKSEAVSHLNIPDSDYSDELGSLLCFLNVLNCSNVHVEKSVSKTRAAMSSSNALPFDSYHYLTIGDVQTRTSNQISGSHHRSPREHLRRGHIRRINESHRVWVNATVVAAGSLGTVTKDYRLKERA